MVKTLPASAGDARDSGSIPGSGRSPGEGNCNPFLYSCLGNLMDRRSLVGYSPWGCKELDITEWLSMHTSTYQYIYLSYFTTYHLSIFIYLFYWDNIQHCVSLGCTMCWSDQFIYCNMIATVVLASTLVMTHNCHFFFCGENRKEKKKKGNFIVPVTLPYNKDIHLLYYDFRK